MKLLLVGELTWSYVVGSSTQKIQKRIFEELKKNKMYVQFFEISPTDSIIKKLLKKTIVNKNDLITGGLFGLWIRILKGEFKIVHLLVLRNYMVLFLPLFFFRTKFVITLHDTYSIRGLEPKKLNHFIRIILIKFAHAIIIFTRSDKNIVSHYHRNENDIFILRHGFENNIGSTEKVKDFKTTTVLFSGGLGKHHKGLNFLTQALEHVDVDYKFLICGTNFSGENHKDYIGAICEKEYLDILYQSKVVVVPSKYESFSLVALEALANGIPVILTKSTGISDYLIDGKGCYIVEFGDVKNLAEKIELLLTDELLWRSMSEEALIIAQEFDWEKIISDYIYIYSTYK